MKIMVTGGAGFIGSHLCEALLDAGYEVHCIDNLSTGRESNIEHLLDNERFTFYEYDLKGNIFLGRMDVIYHLASSIGQMMQHEDPAKHMINDSVINRNVLEYAKTYDSKLIFTSTSEVYGKSDAFPFFEEENPTFGPPWKCRWGYATNKLLMEQMMFGDYQVNGLDMSIVRLFNIIGKRQSGAYGMVVPRFIEQARNGEPLTIFGSGFQSRCFTYIDDCIEGLLLLMKEEARGQLFNLGSNEDITIRELAKRVCQVVGVNESYKFVPYEQAYNQMYEDTHTRIPRIDKIKSVLGWEPTTCLMDALEKISL